MSYIYFGLGDPYVSCITIGCETSEQCPSDKSCINSRCEVYTTSIYIFRYIL